MCKQSALADFTAFNVYSSLKVWQLPPLFVEYLKDMLKTRRMPRYASGLFNHFNHTTNNT